MSEWNKKCFIFFLAFGVVMLFVGYHLGHEGEPPRGSIGLRSSFAVQSAENALTNQPKTRKRSREKNNLNLVTRMNTIPIKSSHEAKTKPPLPSPISQLPQSDTATRKREILFEDHDELSHHNHSLLPQDVIDGVKTFVFFIGYARSGSSIVSSLMDAHPHMVVAYEYKVFVKWSQMLSNKTYLYEMLYNKSQTAALTGWRSEQNVVKSYTLHIGTGWQGRYDNYISVIGDKNAEITVGKFLGSKYNFSEVYAQLQETVGVPVKAVFVVRNPYDIISTRTLYKHSDQLREILDKKSTGKDCPKNGTLTKPTTDFKLYMRKIKESGNKKAYEDAKFRAKNLKSQIGRVARFASAISEMIDLLGSENVWLVHNVDLVNDPKATMMEMCDFFNVYCSADYIQTCVDSVFKSVSKSRELVHWPETEKQLVIDTIIDTFPFFNRYTYDSD